MSTFQGLVSEFPGISIDRFDGENFNSEVYFLSHCHTDHMYGLGNYLFQQEVIRKNAPIYMSNISKEIIKTSHPKLASQIRELERKHVETICVNNSFISVTSISAGHCPGSLMFLFEGEGKRVLYTGDYRIQGRDIRKIKAFQDSFGNVKTIDKIYLDTTFFKKTYAHFPSRQESLDRVCAIIKEWILLSDRHIIFLHLPGKYGYEYLFKEIYNQLKCPVHLRQEVYNLYALIAELDKSVTRLEHTTQIHSHCSDENYRFYCKSTQPDINKYFIRTIKVSAMRWFGDNLQHGISTTINNDNSYYVCYSTHASYSEGVELVKFLRPKAVEANVLADDEEERKEILKNIYDLLNTVEDSKNIPKLFNIDSIKCSSTNVEPERRTNETFNCILDSPPRKTK